MFGEVRSWEERETRESRGMCAWPVCVCAHWILFVEELLPSSTPLHHDDDE
jgi:hypothetical protein